MLYILACVEGDVTLGVTCNTLRHMFGENIPSVSILR